MGQRSGKGSEGKVTRWQFSNASLSSQSAQGQTLMWLYSGITCRPIWMSLKGKIQPLLVLLALTPLKSCSNASISRSFTISNLDMRGLAISPQSTWLNPNVTELAKTQRLACGLLIGSPAALPVSHLKGSITTLWLVILTPVTSGRWTVPTQSVGSLMPPVLPQGKVSRSREEDFKEPCSELSGSFVKHILFHSQTPTLSDDSSLRGKHRGRHFDRLPVDCWCFGCFVTMRLHRPEYEGCSCSSSAIRSSKYKKE